jgi:hypothetical protein
MTKQTKFSAALALVAALGLGAAGAAQAQGSDDVFWSIAMSQPGIRIGVSNAPVVVPAPYPVVVTPRVIHTPPPRVVYVPPPVYRYYGHGHGYGYGYGHGHGHERWEGHRGGREYFARNERRDDRGGHGHGGGDGPRPGTAGNMGNRR